jgi:hypothetical protein
MARGFESKMVEFQQEEAARARPRKRDLAPEDRERAAKRGSLELTRARAAADLARATVPAHRQMLTQAIAALDEQLRTI